MSYSSPFSWNRHWLMLGQLYSKQFLYFLWKNCPFQQFDIWWSETGIFGKTLHHSYFVNSFWRTGNITRGIEFLHSIVSLCAKASLKIMTERVARGQLFFKRQRSEGIIRLNSDLIDLTSKSLLWPPKWNSSLLFVIITSCSTPVACSSHFL